MDGKTSSAIFLGVLIPLCAFLLLTNSQIQQLGSGFEIVLSKNYLNIINDTDIQSYNATSHELTITNSRAESLKAMKEPLRGDFIITVDGTEALNGIFVPPIVSRSYPSTQVVIIYPNFESNYRIMKIQMGYPWDQPTALDPRNSSILIQHFQETGKLTR